MTGNTRAGEKKGSNVEETQSKLKTKKDKEKKTGRPNYKGNTKPVERKKTVGGKNAFETKGKKGKKNEMGEKEFG